MTWLLIGANAAFDLLADTADPKSYFSRLDTPTLRLITAVTMTDRAMQVQWTGRALVDILGWDAIEACA